MNTSYPKGMEKLLSGQINALANTLKVALFSSSYTYSASHEFVSSLGMRIGTDQTLLNKTVTGGVLNADEVDFGTLAAGSTVKGFVVYRDTGNPTTSPLLLHYDTVPGVPFPTNGGLFSIPWTDDIRRIARIDSPVFPKAAERIWTGDFNLLTQDIKVVAVPGSYALDADHEFLSDIGTLLTIPVALANRSITGGTFNAERVDFDTAPAGATVGSVILFRDSGNPATSPLLSKPSNVAGFPLITNSAGFYINWNDGAAKIFSLVPA